MSSRDEEFQGNFAFVAARLTCGQLALVVDTVAVELVRRRLPGLGLLGDVARVLRERESAETQAREIFSEDCGSVWPPP